MTLNISTPFAYYVGHGTLDFDFTDIRKEERITWSANQKQADDFNQEAQTLGLENFHNKYYRILESYPKLREQITYNFNLFLKHTQGDIRAKISTSWLTYLEEGENNQKHRHSNCFYSGVLYIDEEYPEGAAVLELENPLPQFHETIIPQHYAQAVKQDSNNKSLDNLFIKPHKGLYLFFPSHIMHGTVPHKGDPRKSLAFNFVFDSPIYSFDSTYNPKW